MKETGGYYRPEFHAIQWVCLERLTFDQFSKFCDTEQTTKVKYGWGTHILICKECGTKRKVKVIQGE
jgi:hypothetical protein